MTTEVLQPPKLSTSRLLLLGASSLVLCLSYLMAVFAPFPVTIATALYGRLRGYGVALAGLALSIPLGLQMTGDFTLAISFSALMVFAVVISETLLRSWPPVRSVVIAGSAALLLFAGFFAWTMHAEQTTPVDFFAQQIAEAQGKLVAAKAAGKFEQDLTEIGLGGDPKDLARELLQVVPGYLFMGIFFVLWVNMFLALKGQRLLRTDTSVRFDERELLRFKMPFAWAYVVAIALALVVGADYWQLSWAEPVGLNVLRMVGIFYFFQGFGVMLEYLNHFGVLGIFRTFFVMGIVFFVPQVIALLGLFDTWFDFTSKIKNKEKFKENL